MKSCDRLLCLPLLIVGLTLRGDADDFLTRDTLTGDWGGVRTSMADRGFTLGLDSTHFYQGLLAGDGDQSFDYGGRVDAMLALDTGKLGLWEGGSFHSHLEYRYGDLSSSRSRGLMATNSGMGVPLGSRDEIEMTSLYFRQIFAPGTALLLGRLNTVDLLEGDPFFGGYGVRRFMNLAFVAPPTGVTPPVIIGGIFKYQTGPLGWTVMAYDPNDRTTDYWPSDAFEDGVNLSLAATWSGEIAGRKTSATLGGIYSTKDRGDLSKFFQPEELKTGNKEGSWHLSLNFSHLVYESIEAPGTGLGFYFKTAVADGNPNPIRGYFSGGFTGVGVIPGRPLDSFGVGYYFFDFSDDLQQVIDPFIKFGDEEGIEIFYRYAATPWLHITADLQIVNPARAANTTAVLAGLRTSIRF